MRAWFHSLLIFALVVAARAADFTVQRNVEYGKADGQSLQLDVFEPAAKPDSPRPAIVFIHGGGWMAGKRQDMHAMAEPAVKEGYVCFTVGYRLVWSGKNTWPACYDDVQRAVRWVRANAAKYHVDPERVGAIGASAGGHLVAMLGTTDTRDNSDPELAKYSSRVKCVVDLFGPTDLADDFVPKVKDGNFVNGLLKNLFNGTPAEKPEVAKQASPLTHVDAKSSPMLIFHGKLDNLVPLDHSERLDAALKKAGVESKLVVFDNEGHGWGRPENQKRFAAETLAFFKKHLAK